jgi:hypothetical protein
MFQLSILFWPLIAESTTANQKELLMALRLSVVFAVLSIFMVYCNAQEISDGRDNPLPKMIWVEDAELQQVESSNGRILKVVFTIGNTTDSNADNSKVSVMLKENFKDQVNWKSSIHHVKLGPADGSWSSFRKGEISFSKSESDNLLSKIHDNDNQSLILCALEKETEVGIPNRILGRVFNEPKMPDGSRSHVLIDKRGIWLKAVISNKTPNVLSRVKLKLNSESGNWIGEYDVFRDDPLKSNETRMLEIEVKSAAKVAEHYQEFVVLSVSGDERFDERSTLPNGDTPEGSILLGRQKIGIEHNGDNSEKKLIEAVMKYKSEFKDLETTVQAKSVEDKATKAFEALLLKSKIELTFPIDNVEPTTQKNVFRLFLGEYDGSFKITEVTPPRWAYERMVESKALKISNEWKISVSGTPVVFDHRKHSKSEGNGSFSKNRQDNFVISIAGVDLAIEDPKLRIIDGSKSDK